MPATRSPSPASAAGHHESFFARLAREATDWSGSTMALFLAVLLLVIWAASYPVWNDFDTWQLVINTVTTIITFLMVFLIQRAQNKDSQAIHLKLDELIAAVRGASNRLINAEQLSEEDLNELQRKFDRLRQMVDDERSLRKKHSIEDVAEAVKDVVEQAK